MALMPSMLMARLALAAVEAEEATPASLCIRTVPLVMARVELGAWDCGPAMRRVPEPERVMVLPRGFCRPPSKAKSPLMLMVASSLTITGVEME